MTEPKAIEKYGKDNIKIYTSKFSNLHYGIFDIKSECKPKTLMKLVRAGVEEKVVGPHVLGKVSDEMMQGFGVAMKMGCTKADVDSCVAIHPQPRRSLLPWVYEEQVHVRLVRKCRHLVEHLQENSEWAVKGVVYIRI